jgi:hypothetical protein
VAQNQAAMCAHMEQARDSLHKEITHLKAKHSSLREHSAALEVCRSSPNVFVRLTADC